MTYLEKDISWRHNDTTLNFHTKWKKMGKKREN